ncbi:L-fuconolactonase [Cyclobacterium lianum]|uniref:L-fuconolactonase n=1 Tax=Cyclobacterium lianum TaxID=388280 RepID=A0A1M7L7M8_9BACT|nr:amidohydrolase family protein [Cyclobacterium lianum]SHM73924.1 L-fuconolactonase [Cyclobacterium lianum]
MKKIDSHQHFWHYDANDFPWISDEMQILKEDCLPEKLYPELEANEVKGTVAVQARPVREETNYLLDLADKFPFILGVIGWVDLTSDQLADTLKSYQPFPKLKGFRHLLQDESDSEFILKPAFQRGLGQIFAAGYSYDLLVLPFQLAGAIKTASNFPEGRLVLDHMAKPDMSHKDLQEWKDKMRDLAAHPQVYCKLSGMVTEADWENWEASDFFPFLDIALEYFGEERLMFGSDWPVCRLAASYAQVTGILEKYLEKLSVAAQRKIWYENAEKFYHL